VIILGKDFTLSAKCKETEIDFEADTCQDLCEDDSYKLRRLQRYDNRLFNFKTKEKMEGYSRKCQNGLQPMVMHKNPENNSKILKDSYTFAFKYGSDQDHQNYYLCPKVWCPYCEIPIRIADVIDVKKRATRKGMCLTGSCPYGDHDVIINDNDNYKETDIGLFPYFKNASFHPDNFCLPCCGKNRHDIKKSSKYKEYQRCLGHEVEENKVEDVSFYILGRDKIPLPNGRFGLLPIILSKKLFGSSFNSNILPVGKSVYLRSGIKNDEKQSFLMALLKVLSSDIGVDIGKDEFKNEIVKKLNPTLFKSLKNGALKIIFSNEKDDIDPLQNFKNYLLSNEQINETYLWDLLSRPGIVFDQGLNIIIIKNTTILCPFGENINQLYEPNRKTVFIFNHRKYYEPICSVFNNNNNYELTYTFTALNEVVMRSFEFLYKNCKPYDSINWKMILKDNEKRFNIKYNYDLKKEPLLKTVIDKLKNANINITGQVLDYYNKAVGVELVKGSVFVPTKPRGIITDIKVIEPQDQKRGTYKEVVKVLNKLAKGLDLEVKPINKIVNNGKIVGVYLESGRIVPVKEQNNVKDSLSEIDIPYYVDVDEKIYKDVEDIDERVIEVNKLKYKDESYQRYRFEVSEYLQGDDKMKNTLSGIVLEKGKEKEITDIIEKINKKIYAKGDAKFDPKNFVLPNIRVRCETLTNCDLDPFCIKDGSGCKFSIADKKNRSIFTKLIVNELIQNSMKRDQILDGMISDVLDKNIFISDNKTVYLSGSGDQIIRDLFELYSKKSKSFISQKKIYDTLIPKYPGVDRDKYSDYYRDYDLDFLSIEELSHNWKPYLGNEFNVYVNISGNSLFNTIIKGLIKSGMKEKIDNILDLKEQIIDLIKTLSVKDVENIAKKMGLMSVLEEEDKQEPWDMLLELYRKKCKDDFGTVHTMNKLSDTIISKNYNGCLVDLYLISAILKINFIVLYKRITLDNSEGFDLICHDSPFYMVVYVQNRKGKTMFDSIISENKFIFKKDDFPKEFINKVFKSGKGNSIENKIINVESEENKNEKKKKKIIKKKVVPKKKIIKKKVVPKKKIIMKKKKMI
jgi:hypothetical protein